MTYGWIALYNTNAGGWRHLLDEVGGGQSHHTPTSDHHIVRGLVSRHGPETSDGWMNSNVLQQSGLSENWDQGKVDTVG